MPFKSPWCPLRASVRRRGAFLDGGKVVQQGSHEELLRTGGLYRRLYDLQFQARRTAGDRGFVEFRTASHG
jgi:hypothetical protein